MNKAVFIIRILGMYKGGKNMSDEDWNDKVDEANKAKERQDEQDKKDREEMKKLLSKLNVFQDEQVWRLNTPEMMIKIKIVVKNGQRSIGVLDSSEWRYLYATGWANGVTSETSYTLAIKLRSVLRLRSEEIIFTREQ